MTRSSRRQGVFALVAALVAGGWLWAGLSDGPGQASDRALAAESATSEVGDDGWIWSGSREAAASYRWAEDKRTEIARPAPTEAGGYHWDDSLQVADPTETGVAP